MNLPSNKVGLFFILAVLIVSGSITFSIINKEEGNDAVTQESNSKLTINRKTESSNIDRDEDGLLDWEETLRGTDPLNPDSDGDGTKDGEEVRSGRNPKIAGPNDSLTSIQEEYIEATTNFYDEYVQGSLTDRVAVNLISNHLQYNQNSNYTVAAQQDLVNSLTQEASSAVETKDIYKTINLITFVDNKEKSKVYGNNFAELHVTFLQNLSDLQNQPQDSVSYINSIVSLYNNFARNLMALETPKPVADVHVEIANNLTKVATVLDTMNNEAKSDPLKALFLIRDYNKAAKAQPELYKTISNYFSQNDIIFDSSEYGNFWNQI